MTTTPNPINSLPQTADQVRRERERDLLLLSQSALIAKVRQLQRRITKTKRRPSWPRSLSYQRRRRACSSACARGTFADGTLSRCQRQWPSSRPQASSARAAGGKRSSAAGGRPTVTCHTCTRSLRRKGNDRAKDQRDGGRPRGGDRTPPSGAPQEDAGRGAPEERVHERADARGRDQGRGGARGPSAQALYLYDCDRGQGAVYARSLEEAQRTALLDSGRSDPPRNVHLATAEETAFRKAMGGSTS